MQNISHTRAREIIDNCKDKTIAVIGDVMLDRYFWGSVTRISPESPVPVIDLEEETFHLGGAANVANNLKTLGVIPLLCGVIGNDNSGGQFNSAANETGIKTDGLYKDKTRPTTVKTRIIGNNQQITRLDKEVRSPISVEGEEFILNALKKQKNLSGIIFEDYNKGTITKNLIKSVVDFAGVNSIPVFVDPKFENFFEYKDVTVFKPNKKEAFHALGLNYSDHKDYDLVGKLLLEKLNASYVLLTLGKEGMMLFEQGRKVYSVPARTRQVSDVSGAGDTTIAAFAAFYAGSADILESAALANYAAGVVCESPGIVPIKIEKLIETVKRNHVNE